MYKSASPAQYAYWKAPPEPPMPIDHDIIIKVTLRDRTRLLAYILAIIPDEHIAEDILQEVSMASVRKAHDITDEAHLLKWLRRAARLEALRHRRDCKTIPHTLDTNVIDALESHWDQADNVAASDSADALRHCLEQLSPYARQLINLRYTENLTGEQIAKRVDRKLHTVYIAMSRTRSQLADCVRNKLDANESGGDA